MYSIGEVNGKVKGIMGEMSLRDWCFPPLLCKGRCPDVLIGAEGFQFGITKPKLPPYPLLAKEGWQKRVCR